MRCFKHSAALYMFEVKIPTDIYCLYKSKVYNRACMLALV